MCDPKSSGLRDESEPARRPRMLPAASTRTSRPAACIRPVTSLAALPIRGAVGQPRHAAVRVLAELGQLGKMTIDAIAGDARACLHAQRAKPAVRPRRADDAGQSPRELPSSHRVRVTQSPRRPCQNSGPHDHGLPARQTLRRAHRRRRRQLHGRRPAIFGLLGPNGAGKSTTIGCISRLADAHLRPHHRARPRRRHRRLRGAARAGHRPAGARALRGADGAREPRVLGRRVRSRRRDAEAARAGGARAARARAIGRASRSSASAAA